MKLKKTILSVLILVLASCSSSKKTNDQNASQITDSSRKLASRSSLQGTYLGLAEYEKSERKPAVRIYLNEIPGEAGSYHAVLLEYVNLLGILPKYVASNKLEKVSKVIGFLNNIVKTVTVYKVVPARKAYHYDMFELRADTRSITAVSTDNPRQLILSKAINLAHPLEGAAITQNKTNQPKRLSFPVEKSKKDNGGEYGVAKFVYSTIGLDSTWRKEFLPGPYLSAYGNRDDVVLGLKRKGNNYKAYFEVDDKFRYENLNEGQIKKRRKVFTNPKSAFLEGGFVVREPIDGMFTLSPMHSNESAETIQEMSGKIALFVDIFDATKKLNQDVVEVIFINPADPADFHMHYEDPENGEGK